MLLDVHIDFKEGLNQYLSGRFRNRSGFRSIATSMSKSTRGLIYGTS